MANAENRKHLSLLDAIPSDPATLKNRPRKARGSSTEPELLRREGEAERAVPASAQGDAASSFLDTPGQQELRDQPDTAPVLRSEPVTVVGEAPTFELPQRRDRRPLGGLISFVVCVLLPTLLAGVYYFGFASDQYVVEFRFAVRNTNTSVSTSSATDAMLNSMGVSTGANSNENYMVVEYMTSRQAVEDLQAKIGLRQFYARPFIDFWSRLDETRPVEQFTKYWKNMVTAEYDVITGISVASVHAFTADDAHLVAKTLLASADEMINEVTQRPLREAVRYAEAEVKRAEGRLKQVRTELSTYREREGLIEPMGNVVLSNATVASTIRGTLAQLLTDAATLKKQGLAANAPQMLTLQTRIKATEEQLKEVETQISTSRQGSDSAISPVVARYEQLDSERQFAQTMVNSTMQSLEQARANAVTKRLYITAFIQPDVPQISTYPRRFVAVLIVAGACLLLWTIALLLNRSIKEHLA